MGGLRSRKTSAVIATASVLALKTIGADAASPHQNLRHRNLEEETATREYKHLGCFKDNQNDRILGNKMANETHTTADFCYDYCVDKGAPLMATQWSIECWCATEVEVKYDRHGEGAVCDHACAGDEDEMCGGYDAFDLYLIVQDDGMDSGPDGGSDEESDRSPKRKSAPKGALVDDIVKIIPVEGMTPGGKGWADSYSVGDKCYMWTTFDHDIGKVEVDTPKGKMKIEDLFKRMKEGPGHEGRPLYNDIQCGNGPPNLHGILDEITCPGLVEHGEEGCGQIGPKWDLSGLEDE